VLNAANEVAVERFLAGGLGFMQIPVLIEAVLEQLPLRPIQSLDDVLGADLEARACAERWLERSPTEGIGMGSSPRLVQS
jgi:1-deoxy-D-xylulose-5-phosphate reductoisomerase